MREEKKLLLEDIYEEAKKSDSFVIMQYGGLNSNAANEFRNQIAEKGGAVKVIRKRLLMKAAKEMGMSLNLEMLPGHIGVVFGGKDPLETTKTVFSFSKDNGNIIQILAGRFDGQMYHGEAVEQLSQLPGKDEMRAQFLSVLQAPLTETLAVLEAAITSVIYCIDNKAKKAEE